MTVNKVRIPFTVFKYHASGMEAKNRDSPTCRVVRLNLKTHSHRKIVNNLIVTDVEPPDRPPPTLTCKNFPKFHSFQQLCCLPMGI